MAAIKLGLGLVSPSLIKSIYSNLFNNPGTLDSDDWFKIGLTAEGTNVLETTDEGFHRFQQQVTKPALIGNYQCSLKFRGNGRSKLIVFVFDGNFSYIGEAHLQTDTYESGFPGFVSALGDDEYKMVFQFESTDIDSLIMIFQLRLDDDSVSYIGDVTKGARLNELTLIAL